MLWRTPAAKRRPPGFIEPCIPTRVDHPPVGPQWVHEIKHDGYRLIVRKQADRVRLFNGAVCRQRRPGERKRPLDNQWTFGVTNDSTGYMHIGIEVVHRIVATAFHGAQPSEKHIVDHVDTNRRNNRVEDVVQLRNPTKVHPAAAPGVRTPQRGRGPFIFK
jgi:hypothetical protein